MADFATSVESKCASCRYRVVLAASRGGHTRSDYPDVDPRFATLNLVTRRDPDGGMALSEEPLPAMPADLKELLDT